MPNGTDPLKALRSDQRGRECYRIYPVQPRWVDRQRTGLRLRDQKHHRAGQKTARWTWWWVTTPWQTTRRTSTPPAAPAAVPLWAATPTASRMQYLPWGARPISWRPTTAPTTSTLLQPQALPGQILWRHPAHGAESPDGEDGFPGNLKIAVRYTLTEDNAFRMDYRVSSDADTNREPDQPQPTSIWTAAATC